MSNNTCRKADGWDWIAQIATSTAKKYLENKVQAEQEKPVKERNLGLQILYGVVGIPVCDYVTYEINKDLCVPIVPKS
jgi:hypothetical protein